MDKKFVHTGGMLKALLQGAADSATLHTIFGRSALIHEQQVVGRLPVEERSKPQHNAS